MRILKTGFLVGLLTAGLAGGAFAQDVQCGAGLPPGTWIGGDAAASDIATATVAYDLTGAVPPGGYHVLGFTVSTRTQIRVEAAGQSGGDPVIELYDATGTLVLTDDDSGGGLNARAEIALAPGSYCLATRSYGGGPITADIRVGLADHGALTPGSGGSNIAACMADTPATPLGRGPLDQLPDRQATATNSVTGAPYYRFTLGAATPVTIRATNPRADPYIYVFDGAGRLIGENDDYSNLNSRIDFTDALPAGDYCIGMRALSDPDLPIETSVAVFSEAEMMQDLYATAEASPPSDGRIYPVVALGALDTRLVRDGTVGSAAVWHSFTVAAAGLVLIDAVGLGNSDPVIALFDDLGRAVARNDDSNGTLDSQIAARVSPGTYMLGVSQYHGENGVIRVAIERYVPAR